MSVLGGEYKTMKVFRHPCVIQPHTAVYELRLCRADKFNCIDEQMWTELQDFFGRVQSSSDYQDCRIIFICAEGSSFCAGMDLECLCTNLEQGASADVGYRALDFQRKILNIQKTFTLIDSCRVPTVAAIHGSCIGAGVGLAAACDMRVCSEDAFFTVKDIEMGLAADAATIALLQKSGLPLGWIKEFCFSMRAAKADEMKQLGFINHIVENKTAAFNKAFDMCRKYGRKSPAATIGSKLTVNYAREHAIQDTIEKMAVWNAAALQSNDFVGGVEQGQIQIRKRMLHGIAKL